MRSRIWLIITGTTWKVGTNIHVWSLTRPHLGCNQGDMHSGLFKPLLAPNKNITSLILARSQAPRAIARVSEPILPADIIIC